MSLTFLAPQFLWALLAIPIVILLHFIRTRKKRTTVSALFLWRQAQQLAEQKQRFSPSWLLFLQLMFVTLAALALSQPNISTEGPPTRIIIIDTSASMSAVDSDGQRISKAQQQAIRLLRDSSEVAIIRAGLDATVLQALTRDMQEAEQALRSLQAVDQVGDLERAITLARSIAPDAQIHVYTDSETPAGVSISLHPVAGDGLNLGITTLDIGLQQAFISVASNHPRPQEVPLELYQDKRLIAQMTLLVPANGQQHVTFPLASNTGMFEARLVTPDWDALELDNVAYAGTRDLRVVLTEGNEVLERAFAAIPNLSFQVLPRASLSAPGFDVRVLMGDLPENPQGRYLLFSPRDSAPVYQVIRDWDRADPLLRFVDLRETIVGFPAAGPRFSKPDWRVLAQTGELVPVLLHGVSSDYEVIAFNFHPQQSDIINRSAFPLLMTNIMNAFRSETQLQLGQRLPEGSVRLEDERQIAAGAAAVPGVYLVNDERFTASLLSGSQTRLPAFSELPEVAESPTGPGSERVRTLAFWLIALALVFLLAEWLLWSRTQLRFRPVRD